MIGGKIYGIPFQRSTPVFYWNKEIFKAAGLPPDKPPQTWDELKDYAVKLTVRDPKTGDVKQWGVTISGGWNDWLFEAFVRQNGSWLISPDGLKANFNSKEAIEALDFWVELKHRLKVGPPHSTWGSTPPDFVGGRTAMLYHSTGILTFLQKSAKFDFGVAFMPKKKTFGAEPALSWVINGAWRGVIPSSPAIPDAIIIVASPEKISSWALTMSHCIVLLIFPVP